MQTVEECFMLVCGTEAAAEVKDGIIIFQWQISQQVTQFTEVITDIRWVGFMGFLVDFLLSVYITQSSDL